MARKTISTFWDRESRNNTNENFKELYERYSGIVGRNKPPVNTENDLPRNSQEGDTRYVKNSKKTYRFVDGNWIEIESVDANSYRNQLSDLQEQITDMSNNSRIKVLERDPVNPSNGDMWILDDLSNAGIYWIENFESLDKSLWGVDETKKGSIYVDNGKLTMDTRSDPKDTAEIWREDKKISRQINGKLIIRYSSFEGYGLTQEGERDMGLNAQLQEESGGYTGRNPDKFIFYYGPYFTYGEGITNINLRYWDNKGESYFWNDTIKSWVSANPGQDATKVNKTDVYETQLEIDSINNRWRFIIHNVNQGAYITETDWVSFSDTRNLNGDDMVFVLANENTTDRGVRMQFGRVLYQF